MNEVTVITARRSPRRSLIDFPGFAALLPCDEDNVTVFSVASGDYRFVATRPE